MKIYNQQPVYKPNITPKPSFKAWNREVLRESLYSLEVKHRNDTWIFRDGNFFPNLVKYLVKKYEQAPKVNVYCYGCSNGSEVYTFLMSLISNFKENIVKKFTPIIAKDYDPVAIKNAKSKKLPINIHEIGTINKNTIGFNHFFEEQCEKCHYYESSIYDDFIYTAKPILTDNIQFSKADILEDYVNINPKNSVVLARNFWPYLSDKNKFELAEKLHKQMGENSTIVIGDYDMLEYSSSLTNTGNILRATGFKPTDNYLIYER